MFYLLKKRKNVYSSHSSDFMALNKLCKIGQFSWHLAPHFSLVFCYYPKLLECITIASHLKILILEAMLKQANWVLSIKACYSLFSLLMYSYMCVHACVCVVRGHLGLIHIEELDGLLIRVLLVIISPFFSQLVCLLLLHLRIFNVYLM